MKLLYKQLVVSVLTISIAIGSVWYLSYLKNLKPTGSILSPISKSFSIFSLFKAKPKPKSIIYGYLPYWSLANTQYLQLDKLTDIAYFGIYLNADGSFKKTVDREDEETGQLVPTVEPGYHNWRNSQELKNLVAQAERDNVRISLTVIAHEDEVTDKFLDCRECWDTFITNLLDEMKFHKVKHVNLNFEYVELVEGDQPKKFSEFTKFTNEKLDEAFGNSYLVVTTFADSLIKPRISDVEALGNIADGIFIMGYDFHQPNSDNAGPVAPIDGKGVHAEYDINTMLQDYLTKIHPSKVILGVPYYGYNWVVKDNEKYAERVKGSEEVGFSQSQTYEGIMDTILDLEEKPEIKWDELARSPYFTYISPETQSIREVYFDNEQSLREKYKLIKDRKLAGVGIWALGYDGGYVELWNLLKSEFIDIN